MSQTQLASMFIGASQDTEIDEQRRREKGAIIHVLDKQSDEIIETLNSAKGEYTDAKKTDTLDNRNTFDFIALKKFEKLEKRNRLLVEDVDGFFSEYLITFTDQYKHNEKEVRSVGSFVDLQKSKVIAPQKLEGQTPQTAVEFALNGTEYLVGDVDFVNIRTITIEEHTNPYDLLKLIASTFDLELRFRVEVRGNQIVGRYVDLKKYVGHFDGKEIVFGKDLVGIRRIEDSDNIVTALLGIGPEREDGTRLTVLVENEEARQRWGRNGQHLISVYEPESTDQEMTEARLRTLTENELEKRIDASVRYEGEAVSLEKVFGLHHEKIRCGMTVRIKDEGYSPPLYLQARIHETTENPATREITSFKIGDFIEYRREDLEKQVKALRSLLAQKVSEEQVRRRLEKLILVSIISSAGSVFKNGIGSTTLTARTFLSGNEVDEDGTRYEYRWHKFDKNGDYDAGFYEEGKSVTIEANTIDEKASFRVEIILDDEVLAVHEITLTNVFDGEDGEQGPPGPKGEDGKTLYTWIKYADTPTSGMSDNPEGKEYIGIAYNKETPTPSTNYADYVWSKFKGDQGVPGPPGEDGQPSYTWVKYADDENGSGMSDSPDGKLYIGLAFNKTTPEESNNPADYTWSLMPQNIEIGGRNLASKNNIGKWSVGWVEDNYVYTITGPTAGLYIKADVFKTGERYVLTFKAKKISGTVTSLAGHCSNYTIHKVIRDGVLQSTDWQIGLGTNPYPDDEEVHDYEIHFTAKDFAQSDNNFYIQPNRSHYGLNYVMKIWDLMLEKGNKATDWSPAPEDIQEQIDEAKQEAEEAKQEAQQAQTTADGKNSVFTQSTAPPTDGRKIGDVWFDTSRDNLMHRFDGQQWVEAKWGEQSIVANSITANHIKSLVGLNVNDQFIVDSNGNVKFAGHLEGASGTFGEVTVKDGDFYLEDNQSLTKYSVVTKQNFIIDHSFESIQADDPQSQDDIDKNWSEAIIPDDPTLGIPWRKVGSPRVVPTGFVGPAPYEARPIFGERSIAVNKDNYVYQDIYKISPGTYYTISLFAKRVYNMPAGSAQIVIQHIRPLPNGTETVLSEKSSSTMVVRGDYKPVRMATTYLYGNFQDGDFLRIIFKSTNSNWVMVDGVQLVEGDYPTVYNSEDSFHDFMHGLIRWGHFVGENTILAYGESDNGHFVRFGNGFQICWIDQTVSVDISAPYGSLFLGYYQWTFPAAFTSTPTVSCSYFKWGTGASWGTINEVSTTNASLRGIDSFERNAGSTRISAVAMGWWK